MQRLLLFPSLGFRSLPGTVGEQAIDNTSNQAQTADQHKNESDIVLRAEPHSDKTSDPDKECGKEVHAAPKALLNFTGAILLDHAKNLIVGRWVQRVTVGRAATVELGIRIGCLRCVTRVYAAGWTAGGQIRTRLESSRGGLRTWIGWNGCWRRSVPGESSLNSEVIGKRTKGLCWSIGVDARGGKDIIKALTSRINGVGRDFTNFALCEAVLLVLVPTPGIIDRVASNSILEKVEVGCRQRPVAILLRRVRSVRTPRMKTTYMGVENLNNILSPGPEANLCARDTLAHVPVSSPKSGRPSIERIFKHRTLLDRPVTQDGQAASERAAVVELSIRKNLASMVTDSFIILLSKTFLQSHDLRCRHSVCDSASNFVQSCVTLRRNVSKAPAIQSQEIDVRRRTLRIIMVDDYGRRRRDMLRGVTCRDHGAGRVCGSNGD
ncbi:hypothetical protein HG531_001604 [Fusarium graminearum]|nr:hypothetical protein HG531_001604 [Fusarium graminearum]